MADFYILPQMNKHSNFILWKLETDDKGKQRKIPYVTKIVWRASFPNNFCCIYKMEELKFQRDCNS